MLAQPVAAPAWQFWRYQQPAIVLGSAQRADHQRLLAAPGGPPMEVLLRDSGGGVLIGPWMISLSLALPLGHPWLARGLVDSYRPLGQLCAAAMKEQGMSAQALAPQDIPTFQAMFESRGLPALDWACFGKLSPWEVVDVQGRKIVGLAQRRRQTGVLMVAGLLLEEPPWELLCGALGQDEQSSLLHRRTGSVAAFGGADVERERLQGVLQHALTRCLGEAERAEATALD